MSTIQKVDEVKKKAKGRPSTRGRIFAPENQGMIFTSDKGQSLTLNDIVGHIVSSGIDKERKFFTLSRKACDELEYIQKDLAKNGSGATQSRVIEQALHTYYSLYTYVEKLIEKVEK